MKEILLTQEKVAIVDDGNFERLNQHKWYALRSGNTFYAARKKKIENKRAVVLMHREVLDSRPGDPIVDHRDGNGLNNARKNLREAVSGQNQMNSHGYLGSLSKFKGVSICKRSKKWRACIQINGKKKHLGYFNDEQEAAKAYDKAAKEYFREYARINFEATEAAK